MSARRSGKRSAHRSAKWRILRVATRRHLPGHDPVADCCADLRRRSSHVGRLGRGRRRQEDGEGRSSTLVGDELDPAGVALDDVPGDRQSKARATTADARPVDLVEALEDPPLGGSRDADAMVLDRDAHLSAEVARPDADGDIPAIRTELDGVVEQVDEDLAEALLVRPDRRQVVADIDDELHALALSEQAEPLRRRRGETADIDDVAQGERRPGLRFATGRGAR